MIALRHRDMRAQRELAGIDAQLLLGRKAEAGIRSWRKVHSGDGDAITIHHHQLRGDETLLMRSVRVDVVSVLDAEMHLDHLRTMRRPAHLLRTIEAYGCRRLPARVWRVLPGQLLRSRLRGSARKRQSSKRHRNMADSLTRRLNHSLQHHFVARAFLMLASISSREASPAVSSTTLPSRPT